MILDGAITGCTATYDGGNGIYAAESAVSDCTATYNHDSGIVAGTSSVTGCTATQNAIGIEAERSDVTGCTFAFNTGAGIQASLGTRVRGNTGFNGDGVGILVPSLSFPGAGCRVEENVVTGYASGVKVMGEGSVIIKNSARSNTANYEIAVGNTVGEILDYSSGGTITSSNPWANFEF